MNIERVDGLSPTLSPGASAALPIGAVGLTTESRDDRGRFKRGNGAALNVGHRSAAFWNAHEALCGEIVTQVLRDAGHTRADAPRALLATAESIAQSLLVRDSAYARVAEGGGPLSVNSRARRAFTVWCQAVDRLERHLRLVGLGRRPAPVSSLAAILAASDPKE